MTTTRKHLRVLLTPEQYEAFHTVMHQRGYQSMSQLAAQILIEACGLPGDAPKRGKYSRHELYAHTQDNPVTERVQNAFTDGYISGKQHATTGFAPVPYEDDDIMPSGALERLKAQKRAVENDE